jgi:hypothetical protein
MIQTSYLETLLLVLSLLYSRKGKDRTSFLNKQAV